MTTDRNVPLTTMASALLCGVLWYLCGKLLPPQLDFVAGFAVLLTVIGALAHAEVLPIPHPDRVLLGVPAVLLLGAALWRDSEPLVALDFAALVVLVALAVPGLAGRTLLASGASEWIVRGVRAGASFVLGAIPAAWGAALALPAQGRGRGFVAPTLGVLVVAPVLVVFASLLSGADPLFGDVLRAAFAWDLWRIGPDLLLIGVGTWFAAGLLWAMARPQWFTPPLDRLPRVPVVSVVSALVAVEALFGLFVIFQARHLFGGQAYMLATEGLTVAEYARRGFFELVVVVALSMPLLMTAEWLVDRDAREDRRRLRLHAFGILGLLVPILVSAMSRMLLYTGIFGLTQSRFYTVAFMGWLAVVMAWFAATSLQGVRHRFMAGAFASGVQVLLLLNVVNPEAIIVRVNVARVATGRSFDASYVSGLGAGALPALLARADRLPAAEACKVLDAQRARLDRARGGEWNVERHRAAGTLRDDLDAAVARACGVRN